ERRQHSGAGDVVGRRILDLDDSALADVHTDDRPRPARAQLRKALRRSIRPCVIETHAVDDSTIRYESEQTRRGVTLLRNRCDGTNLDVTESKSREAAHTDRVLVETRRNTEWRVEGEPKGADLQFGIR